MLTFGDDRYKGVLVGLVIDSVTHGEVDSIVLALSRTNVLHKNGNTPTMSNEFFFNVKK